MGSVEEILEILNGAKSDTQMLLGLSCVPKFINIKAREKTEGDWEKKLFSGVARTVPLDFFQRLISSDSTPSDCPPFMYKSVAFSVLSAILVYVEREDQLAQFCHLVCEGLTSLMDLYRENHIEQEDFNSFVLTVKDGMSCCRFLSPQMSVDQLEMEITKLISVGRTVTKIPQLTAESIDLLHGLVELSLKKSIGIRNSREFDEYVHNIVINMKADRTEAVMESFRHLSSVLTADLQSIYCRGITEVPVWIEDLLNLTFGIIQSRLKHPVKQVAICMADSLIELFGLKCFYSHPSYFQLLVSITTVELKLLLEEVTEKQATTNQKELLFSCSSILELAVKFLSDETCGSLAMSDSQLNQTNEIVLEAVKMVGEFLVTWANQLHCAKDEVLNPQLIPPLYRFLCTFLSDDCTLLLQELKIGLPAILSIAQWLTQKQTEFDAVGLLLPGLSHMTADENLLKLVVDGGGLPLCVEYFRYTVVSIIKAMPVNEEMDTMNRKLIGVLIVLLNLLIANEKATELCWVVPLEDLFGLIGKVWIQKAGQCLDPTVTAHLVAIYLQLALCLHSAKNNKEIEQLMKDTGKHWFFILELLRSRSFAINSAQNTEMSDMDELWMFCMESLISLTKVSDYLKTLLKSSAWYDEMFVRLRKATEDKKFDEMTKKFVSLVGAIQSSE